MRKFKALIFLGYHFTLHFMKRFLPFARRGLDEFNKDYRDDRIFAISPEQRELIPHYSHCYSCRLCDTVCPEISQNPAFLAPSFLVSSFSRSLTDFYHFEATNSCAQCSSCETICPQDVPIKRLIDYMKETQSSHANP